MVLRLILRGITYRRTWYLRAHGETLEPSHPLQTESWVIPASYLTALGPSPPPQSLQMIREAVRQVKPMAA